MTWRRSSSSLTYGLSNQAGVVAAAARRRLYASSSGYCTSARCCATHSMPRRSYPLPSHLETVLRSAVVKMEVAGTSSGLLGFLFSSVSLSLLHATAPPKASAASATRCMCLMFIMVMISRRSRYGVTRTLKPKLREFGIDAYSSPCVPAWLLYDTSGSTFGTLDHVYRLRPVKAMFIALEWNRLAQRCGSSNPTRSSRNFTQLSLKT